jgi:ribosomal protein L7/L12
MTKFTRDDVTTVLMALDTKVQTLQQQIADDVLDGEYKTAANKAKNLMAILNGMAEFDCMAPQYPDMPEDNMPEMSALYIKDCWDNRQKIPGIKAIREPFCLDLREAKALFDAVENGYPVFVGYIGKEVGNKVAQELFDNGWDAWCVTSNAEADNLGLSKAVSLAGIKANLVPSLLY